MDPEIFEQEFEARFASFRGRAYQAFRVETHTALLSHLYEPDAPLVLCFDFNVEPGAAVVLQELELPNGLAGTAVIGEVHIPYDSDTVKVCSRPVADWEGQRGPVRVYGAATGGQVRTSAVQGHDWQLVRQELRGHFERFEYHVPDANPPERERVNCVNARLLNAAGEVRLMVAPVKAPKVVEDFEGVRLVEGGSGEIAKTGQKNRGLTHWTDTVGYDVARRWPIKDHSAQHSRSVPSLVFLRVNALRGHKKSPLTLSASTLEDLRSVITRCAFVRRADSFPTEEQEMRVTMRFVLATLVVTLFTSAVSAQRITGISPERAAKLPGVRHLFFVDHASAPPRIVRGREVLLGEVVARFLLPLTDRDVEREAVLAGAHEVTRMSPLGLFLLRGRPTVGATEAMMKRLWETDVVVDMSPNYLGKPAFQPNDPQYQNGAQWHLEDPSDIDLDASSAWDITRGSSDVVVAFLDTGTVLDHPEFSNRFFVNPGEVPGNGDDDDDNGYPDDVNGWNTAVQAPDPPNGDVEDRDVGHGTRVSSVLAANTNNSTRWPEWITSRSCFQSRSATRDHPLQSRGTWPVSTTSSRTPRSPTS